MSEHVKTHDRPCSECRHSQQLVDGWICRKHLMAITADMHVSYTESSPLCFEDRGAAALKEKS